MIYILDIEPAYANPFFDYGIEFISAHIDIRPLYYLLCAMFESSLLPNLHGTDNWFTGKRARVDTSRDNGIEGLGIWASHT